MEQNKNVNAIWELYSDLNGPIEKYCMLIKFFKKYISYVPCYVYIDILSCKFGNELMKEISNQQKEAI